MDVDHTYYYKSPVGILEFTGNDDGVSSIIFQKGVLNYPEDQNLPLCLEEAVKQFDEYFDNTRKAFTFKMKIHGTEFQKKIWNELLKIPFGRTVSYEDIALAVGSKNMVRAVGNANGSNKIVIVIPCHRVIGKDRSLTGFGGGLHNKEWLLNFEQGVRTFNLF